MAEQVGISEFDGKTVLVFRSGKWNGSPYTKEDVKTIFDNTVKDAVDLPFRPHMGFFAADSEEAEGWVGVKTLEMPTENKITGELSNVSEEMAEKLRLKKFRYVSPEIGFPNWKAMQEHDVSEASIIALAPVSRPAIRPQKPLTTLEDGSCRELLMDDSWSENSAGPINTRSQLQGGKFSMEWEGNGEHIAKTLTQTTKESVMTGKEKKTEVVEDPTKTSDGSEKVVTEDFTKTTGAASEEAMMLSRKAAELEVRLERLSRGKVRAFAEQKLVGTTRLHKSHLEDFVERTMNHKLDDTEEDKEHKTALDRHLEAEFKTRAASVELSETAYSPDPNAEAVETTGAEENDLEMARLEEVRMEGEGSGYSKEANELDALACKIQTELKCDYGKAMNLAYKRIMKKEGA